MSVHPSIPDIRLEDVEVEYLWSLFERSVGCDTSVRIGENRLDPRDTRIATYAEEVAGPALEALGASVEIDELNNVIGRFGSATGEDILFVSYSAIHHGNDMRDPLRARRVGSDGDEIWSGLGASQGKGGFAAVCAAVRLLHERGLDIDGAVTLAVSSEGSSSHVSAESMYRRLNPLPVGAVLTIGTENRISLGNRGRADIVVEIIGRATHSSAPETGENPIPLVGRVQQRLATLWIDPGDHELLGRRTLVPYKLVCGPVAPHTIPESCVMIFDRRLLPGDDPGQAVAEVADVLQDLPVTVEKGPFMLPALVDPSSTVVMALQAGAQSALGRAFDTFYPQFTFDAGYLLARSPGSDVRPFHERHLGVGRARRRRGLAESTARSRRGLRRSNSVERDSEAGVVAGTSGSERP